MKWIKSLLIIALKGLVGALASVLITALVTGQPLAGLTKLEGLYNTFVKSSVPAWAFALVFLVALFGLYYALTHLPSRRAKGKVHFVADAYNCGWSKRSSTDMDVRIGGTFTYEGPGELIVLQAYLKGSQPTTDLTAQVLAPDGTAKMLTTAQLWLRAGVSERVLIHLYLRPLLGTPGKPLRRELVLRDNFNRSFSIGPVEFPYIGQKV